MGGILHRPLGGWLARCNDDALEDVVAAAQRRAAQRQGDRRRAVHTPRQLFVGRHDRLRSRLSDRAVRAEPRHDPQPVGERGRLRLRSSRGKHAEAWRDSACPAGREQVLDRVHGYWTAYRSSPRTAAPKRCTRNTARSWPGCPFRSRPHPRRLRHHRRRSRLVRGRRQGEEGNFTQRNRC